ncbi:MAG: heparan-alpha-glucosaminide N-acetyltransferase domain-containing protein [Bacteroidota bacterium]
MSTKQRILSVDIFRGATIAAMILVNTPGTWSHVYAPFLHAEWHGLTPTDLIFPFFLFIVGMSITFAYTKKKATGITVDVYKKIISRTLKLIFLGLFLAGFKYSIPFFKELSHLRIPGVLQRIGVVFFIASILFLHFNWKTLLGIFVVILVGYWLIMTQIPVNGEMPLLTKESNLASVVDLNILTVDHMWKTLYDPEGILSTIPAIATTIFGMFLGMILLNKEKTQQEKLKYFVIIGIVALAIGYVWSIVFPLNKALWTSSFVLVTGGWASLIYAAIYYVADILGHNEWGKPAIIFGSNAITVYFLSSFMSKTFGLIKLPSGQSLHGYLYEILSSIITIPKLSSLIYAILIIIFYYLIAHILYKKKIFIKV